MNWFILGLIAGIFVPAPYDAIVRDNVTKAWNWVKSNFNS